MRLKAYSPKTIRLPLVATATHYSLLTSASQALIGSFEIFLLLIPVSAKLVDHGHSD